MDALPAAPIPPHAGSPAPRRLRALPMLNRFARLGDPFVAPTAPVPLRAPRLLALSAEAARLLGLDPGELGGEGALELLAGNAPLPGGAPAVPVRGGHRFGAWAGRLGDAGSLLLGEAVAADGSALELRLDRAGAAPGLALPAAGGREAAIRAALRAFLGSEALHGLGIPTTRALAVLASAPGQDAAADAAVLLRLAPSFVSFGHFEHFYFCGRHDALRVLADHLIDAAFPELRAEPQPCFALLRETTLRTARLVAAWQAAGFCHGLMHTDSMSMLGLTMDHGPFAFMEGFDAHRIANPDDTDGRYAWAAQPGVGERNCAALAQAMLPLVGSTDEAQAAIAPYRRVFTAELERLLRERLGLLEEGRDDRALFDALFALLHENRADFPRFFRGLAELRSGDDTGDGACRALCVDKERFDAWAAQYRQRLRQEARDDAQRAAAMLRANPARILRARDIEDAVQAAAGPEPDLDAIARLQQWLARPFDDARSQPPAEGPG